MLGSPVQDEQDIPYRAEVARKLLHLISLVVPLAMWHLGRDLSIVLLVPTALLITIADVLRFRSAWFYRFIDHIFGFMMRDRERYRAGQPVVLNGATCLIISAAILAVVFPIRIAAISLAVFMVADAAAALAGRRLGRHRWPGTEHTVEGSIAFAVTATIALGILGGFPIGIMLLAALVGAVVEIFPRPFNDNIQVPVVMAIILLLPELSLFT